MLAIGDDRTDQEMYAALPDGAVSVHVGTRRPSGPSRHQHLILARRCARLLREIVEDDAATATVLEADARPPRAAVAPHS